MELPSCEISLTIIIEEILSLPVEDISLRDKASTIKASLHVHSEELKIRRLHHDQASSPKVEKASIPKEGSMKLYKLSVPTFNGDILNWATFSEQFAITIDEKKELSNTQKLEYLQDTLKDSPAKDVIAGIITI